jgi:hypothetical protein
VSFNHDLRPTCLRCIGLCLALLTAVSPKSSSIEILDQFRWSLNKDKDYLRDCMVEEGEGLFSRVVQVG